MPFQRKSDWKFSWEQDAEKGIEFIRPITTHTLYNHWTRALRTVSGLEKSGGKGRSAGKNPGPGVLVIHFHDKPIGVVGSPTILEDILLAWRGMGNATLHPTIKDELALLADSTKPAPSQPLKPSTLVAVRHRPNDIGRFLHEQAKQGGIVAILYYQITYAFLIPLPILARFRHEAKDGTAWADAVLNWLCLPDHAPVKNKLEQF